MSVASSLCSNFKQWRRRPAGAGGNLAMASETLEQRFNRLIAAVDPAAVRDLLATFPPPYDIGPRDNWASIGKDMIGRLRTKPEKRLQALRNEFAAYEKTLERDISTYNVYWTRGLASLTAYDVCISSMDSPLGALRQALNLKSAHISWDLSIMVYLQLEIERLSKA